MHQGNMLPLKLKGFYNISYLSIDVIGLLLLLLGSPILPSCRVLGAVCSVLWAVSAIMRIGCPVMMCVMCRILRIMHIMRVMLCILLVVCIMLPVMRVVCCMWVVRILRLLCVLWVPCVLWGV